MAGDSTFKGVIFDFNGTLYQDTALQVEAWKRYAWQAYGKELTQQQYEAHVHGLSSSAAVEYLAGHALEAAELAAQCEEKEAIYRTLSKENWLTQRLSPGAALLLGELALQDVKRTVATGSMQRNVEFYIEDFGLERWFEHGKIAFEAPGVAAKPAPDIYLLAAQKLGLPPSDCVAIEDSPTGVASAKAAGIGRVVVLAPSGENAPKADGVWKVVSSFYELEMDMLLDKTSDK